MLVISKILSSPEPKLCFATGTLFQMSENKNTQLDLLRNLNLNLYGVEITFAKVNELNNFYLTKTNQQWLRSLNYVSIHAPFNLLDESFYFGPEYEKYLTLLSDLSEKINSQNLLIHPHQLPRDLSFFENFNINFMTENLYYLSPDNYLSDIFLDCPSMGLCLDVAHAYLTSPQETSNLTRKYFSRIKQIHLSGIYKKDLHISLRKAEKSFFTAIEPVYKLDLPLIIEEHLNKLEEEDLKKYLKEEYTFIYKLFSK